MTLSSPSGMPIDDVVMAAEHCLKRSLEPIEKLILTASWQGLPYNVIAETSGYANVYVREVGARLWQALTEALGTKVTKKTLSLVLEASARPKSHQFDYPSGPLSLDSPFYIDRPLEMSQAQTALAYGGGVLRIQGARSLGKTSFLFRVLAQAKRQGFLTVSLGLRQLDTRILESFEAFSDWLSQAIAQQLNLPRPPQHSIWGGAQLQLSHQIHQILAQLDGPLLLALRDMDCLLSKPDLLQIFCAVLDGWQEEARRNDVWGKLRLAISYTDALELPREKQPLLRAGLEIRLQNLAPAQITQLAEAYNYFLKEISTVDTSDSFGGTVKPTQQLFTTLGDKKERDYSAPSGSKAELTEIIHWVNGHPYLLALTFYHLSNGKTLNELLSRATEADGIYSSYLRHYLGWLQEQPELAIALRTITLANQPIVLSPPEAHRLASAGLVISEQGRVQLSCQLYRQYFTQQLQFLNLDVPAAVDVSQLKQLEARVDSLARQVQELQQFSHLDRLTQLTSRQFFEQRVQQACDQANDHQTPLALMLCAFDHYDVYVKAYGYPQAESVLRQIADCLRESVEGPMDNFARYGSEQFIVILPGCSIDWASAMAERLRERVESLAIPQSIGYMGWSSQVVTVSIGIAVKTTDAHVTAAQLLATTEASLTQAQRQGNNCIDARGCPPSPNLESSE